MTDFLDYSLEIIFSEKIDAQKKGNFTRFLQLYKYQIPMDVLNNIDSWLDKNVNEKNRIAAYGQLKKAYLNHWKKSVSHEDLGKIEKFYDFLSLGEQSLVKNAIEKEKLSSSISDTPLTESQKLTLALKDLKSGKPLKIQDYLNNIDRVTSQAYYRLHKVLNDHHLVFKYSYLLEIAYNKTKYKPHFMYNNENTLFIKPSFFKTIFLEELNKNKKLNESKTDVDFYVFQKFLTPYLNFNDVKSKLSEDEKLLAHTRALIAILDRAFNKKEPINSSIGETEFHNYFENIDFIKNNYSFLNNYCNKQGIKNVADLFTYYYDKNNTEYEHAEKVIKHYLLNNSLIKIKSSSKIHKI